MKLKNKRLDEMIVKLFYIIFALAIVAVVFVMIFIFKGPRQDVFDIRRSDQAANLEDADVTLKKTADYGQNYIDSITFFGDSTIARMLDLEILTGGSQSYQVWSGEDGDIPLDSNIAEISVLFPENNETVRIGDAMQRRSPKYLIVTLGINNGVPYCDKEAFSEYYQNIIDVLKESSPSTTIILQSVFPVSKKAERKNPAITNEKIDRANSWIIELCAKNDLKFLNTASALKNEKGYLNSDYVSEDGISMNDSGYKKVLRYIRTHGYN